MPLKAGSSQKTISKNIHEMVAAGHSPRQAVAASLHKANYAEGGEVEMDDDQALLDHVALECMHAIEMKDKSMFLEALQVLVSHICESMMEPEEGEEGME